MIGSKQIKRKRDSLGNSPTVIIKRLKMSSPSVEPVRKSSDDKISPKKPILVLKPLNNTDEFSIRRSKRQALQKEKDEYFSVKPIHSGAMVSPDSSGSHENTSELSHPQSDDRLSESSSDDSESDSDGKQGEMSAYERNRLMNIEANTKFFASLGIFKARDALSHSMGSAKKKKPSQYGLKTKVHEKSPLPPPRTPSLRLRGLNPSGDPVPDTPSRQTELREHREYVRKAQGPLPLTATNIEEDEAAALSQVVKNVCQNKISKKPSISKDFERFLADLSRMSITEKHVAKVVPSRIFSVAVHPSESKTLLFAGDKTGHVGLWEVDGQSKQNGVFTFEPHSRPVTCLQLPRQHSHKLYSCSYDGTVRCGDFEKSVFDEVCSSTVGLDVWYSHFDFLSPSGDVLVLAHNENNEGSIAVVDTRTAKKTAENFYRAHDKSIKTVSVHPVMDSYIATSSRDCSVAVWDIRNMKAGGKINKRLASTEHSKTVSAAYFSPLTGGKIVTTSYDDRIRVLDFTADSKGISTEVKKSFSHNNQTGRWLTPFRAVWHPSREDAIIIGALSRPRKIQIYNDWSHNIHNFLDEDHLCSVCCINAFHPTRNLLVGGNASGRLYVFMEEN
ncbi:WD repeat-containing protein 76-like [Saccoglossus kowalevskii]